MARAHVFLSYSHRDAEWLDRLAPHLEVLKKSCDIDIWSDKRISVGERWLDAIDAAIASCSVAVMLLSEHYLASTFITSSEIPALFSSAQQNGMRLLVVVLRPCLVDSHVELSSLQFLNSPTRTLEEMTAPEQSRTLLQIATALRALVDAPEQTLESTQCTRRAARSNVPEKLQNKVILETNSPAIGLDGRLVENIGVATAGEVFTPLLNVGISTPAHVTQVFSTASDWQPDIKLRLYRGLGRYSIDCFPLGEHVIFGFPVARRGVPQISFTLGVRGRSIYAEVVDSSSAKTLSIGPYTGT